METRIVLTYPSLPMTWSEKKDLVGLIFIVSPLAILELYILVIFINTPLTIGTMVIVLPVLLAICIYHRIGRSRIRHRKEEQIEDLCEKIFFVDSQHINSKPELDPRWSDLLILIGQHNMYSSTKNKIDGMFIGISDIKPTTYAYTLIRNDPKCAKMYENLRNESSKYYNYIF
ncbi:hypothetical protein IPF86_00995 [Candidatus Nomurabacteria bacterium]|nr:MAG: hypothetical protein IPF86_00995 [Candidatus Nomurabacteria bacterium]